MTTPSPTRRALLAAGACLIVRGGPGIIHVPGAQDDRPGCGIDLRAEVARVRGELATFRDRYLPVLMADRSLVERHGSMRL